VPIDLRPGEGFYKPAHKQFAPRFGSAYRPFGSNRTVLRGGYGILYNATINLALIRLSNNPPFATQAQFLSNPGAPPITFDDRFPSAVRGALPGFPSFSGVVDNFRAGEGHAGYRASGGARAVVNGNRPPRATHHRSALC
jgi:hypothetical protein